MKRQFPILALFLGACGPSGPTETALVDHMLWNQVEAAQDPFTDRPADATCGLGGAKVEDGVFEIETDACAYLTAEQPLAIDLQAGDRAEIVVWHLALIAPEPTEAHLAVMVDGEVVVEERPAIPGSENVMRIEWVVPRDISAGAQVLLHAHNHGYNSYRFGPLDLSLD